MAEAGKSSRAKGKAGSKDKSAGSETDSTTGQKEITEPQAEEKSAETPSDGAAKEEAETEAQSTEPDESGPESPDSPPGEARSPRRGGVIGFVLGGALAAGLGYGAAWYGLVGGADDGEIRAAVSAQDEEIGKLRAALENTRLEAGEQLAKAGEGFAALDKALAQIREELTRMGNEAGEIREQMKAIAARQEEISGRIENLEKRISEIEKRPIADAEGAVAAAVAAYEQEIADLRQRLETQSRKFAELDREIDAKIAEALAQAEKISERTARNSALAEAESALARIRGAIETGGGFREALDTISRTLGITPPPVLAKAAEKGVTPLAELQAEFPEMARAALTASLRAAPADSPVERLGAFLKSQVAPRSLEPREGDDPDAVLSRAEAALRAGNLEKALAILDALPEPGKAAMESWIAKARERLEAIRALEELQKAVAAKREGE